MTDTTIHNHQIFICYRREDSSDVAGRIYDHLVLAFGTSNVFKDVDAIPFGVDFEAHVNEVLSRCQVVLVVIGQNWLGADIRIGGRRLDDVGDYVRAEIRASLHHDLLLIPVLIHGADMPRANHLPEDIRALASRNAATVRRDPDFRGDMGRIIRDIRSRLGEDPEGGARVPRLRRFEEVQPLAVSDPIGGLIRYASRRVTGFFSRKK